MNFKVVYLSSLLLLVKCEPPNPQYGPPISSYGTPNYNADHQHDHHDYSAPKSYEFGYQVKDDYSGNNYKRREASDGNQVQGEYRVQLPDGRTQIVTYYADWQTGFHADVRYEGEASYPENFNGYGGPGGLHHGGNNQYGLDYGGHNHPATSSVSIKDYSGPGTPYTPIGYDSYASGGNFGHKLRPNALYGAP